MNHLPFKSTTCPRWLLPGDPKRAEKIADEYLTFRHDLGQSREFNAYVGTYRGTLVGVCSTGIGPASLAIAVEDLIAMGATEFVRVGTCGSLTDDVKIGQVCVATGAVRADGTSEKYVGLEFPAVPDAHLTSRLAGDHYGFTYSSCAFHREPKSYPGAISVEMEAATLFVIASLYGVRAACVCAVVDDSTGWATGEPGIHEAILSALEAVA